jgi:hypothetical protein
MRQDKVNQPGLVKDGAVRFLIFSSFAQEAKPPRRLRIILGPKQATYRGGAYRKSDQDDTSNGKPCYKT